MKLCCYLFSFCVTILGFESTFAREKQDPSLRWPNTQERSIETRQVAPGLFSVSVTSSTKNSYKDAERELLPAREVPKSCVLYLQDVYYYAEDPKNVEEIWVCTFHNYVWEDSDRIPHRHSFELSGLSDANEYLLKHKLKSGSHILRWEDAGTVIIDESLSTLSLKADISETQNEKLWIQASPVKDNDDGTSNRKLQYLQKMTTTGVKKTLVIRIVADGFAPEASLTDLRDEVFGSELSLKSQIESCSHGNLVIEPYDGETLGVFKQKIVGGVIEVGIPINPNGKSEKMMENEAMAASWYIFGDLTLQFDLVLFSLPPGTVPPFAAYAYVGSPFSYFSGFAIRDVMIQMHEVGHNLGLQHSGEGDVEWADTSGYMGYSNTFDPRMCYNAVNNYQLDWYSKLSISPTSVDGYGGTFFISSIAGYDPNDTTKIVTLRLVQENSKTDYYVGYNEADGMNAETLEDGDKVIVFTKDGAFHESVVSWKKASLHVGESYVIENFDNSGRSVTVTFSAIESTAAVIEITPETSESPTSSPGPVTSPSANPTLSALPSLSPSSTPTNAPMAPFTLEPTYLTTTGTTFLTTFAGSTKRDINVIVNEIDSEIVCDNDLLMSIEIRTDYFPDETWWKFKKIGGDYIDEVDPYTYEKEDTSYMHSYCLDYDNCYLFRIYDKGEDGMGFFGGTTSAGYYKGFLGNEMRFMKQGNFGKKKTHRFCTPSDPRKN